MPKNDFMSPKAIANRIKAKGLQKLRWYCQMCQKQCRDENGFKCHLTSESHQRQMQLFQENPHTFIDTYSQQFKDEFLQLLRHRFHTNRVYANMVYNEYIHDRHHVHMNATVWQTLTDFVKYLGREGVCKVDETPKGWYLAYIDREAIEKMEAEKRKERMELDDVERAQRALAQQIERGKKHEEELGPVAPVVTSDEVAREMYEKQFGSANATIQFQIAPVVSTTKPAQASQEPTDQPAGDTGGAPAATSDGTEPASDSTKDVPVTSSSSSSTVPSELAAPSITTLSSTSSAPFAFSFSTSVKSSSSSASVVSVQTNASSSTSGVTTKKRKALDVLESLMEESKRTSLHAQYSKAYDASSSGAWLITGIVVKIMTKVADGKYYKQKGVVNKLVDPYVGEIADLESSAVLRIDQEDLETVLPAVGGMVTFVKGPYRGKSAELLSLEVEKFCCTVKIRDRDMMGVVIKGVAYEDVCKLNR